MCSLFALLFCIGPVIVTLCLLPAPVPPITRAEVIFYVGNWFYGVFRCCMAMPSCAVSRVSAFANVVDNSVNRVITVETPILRGEFRDFAYLVGFDFCRSRGTRSGPLLSVTSIRTQVVLLQVFSRQPF